MAIPQKEEQPIVQKQICANCATDLDATEDDLGGCMHCGEGPFCHPCHEKHMEGCEPI